jgi:hypothetical protein
MNTDLLAVPCKEIIYDEESNGMTYEMFKRIIVKAFHELDSSILKELDGNASYSYDYKFELIEKLEHLFEKYKSMGLKKLMVQDSKCNFCYKDSKESKAYSFHHPDTGEFLIRYVLDYEGVADDGGNIFKVNECTNIPLRLPESSDGLPF